MRRALTPHITSLLIQASHYHEECRALFESLRHLEHADWRRVTQFKGWSFNDVLGHLYMFDHIARLSLQDPASSERVQLMERCKAAMGNGDALIAYTRTWHGLEGRDLLLRWHEHCDEVLACYLHTDPAQRIDWAGPSMSARSIMSARQMETWAHGQAILDSCGIVRRESDRIKNIAILGINTYLWTFENRGMRPPGPAPAVTLTAPSGAAWRWHDSNKQDLIAGSAADFCAVVSQTRNFADTNLRVSGPIAEAWMSIAQCFAGPPQQPPAPHRRFVSNSRERRA